MGVPAHIHTATSQPPAPPPASPVVVVVVVVGAPPFTFFMSKGQPGATSVRLGLGRDYNRVIRLAIG